MPVSTDDAIAAVQTSVALVDRSHWGRIQVSGADRLRFLHNQTTNDLQSLQPGQGCETVFVTSTGRTIDLVTALLLEESVLLLTSPGYDQRLIDWMDRYIFFADRVELKNLTSETACFTLIGSQSDKLLESIGATLPTQPYQHQVVSIAGVEVRISVGTGLALPGYTLFVAAADADSLRQHLTAEATILGDSDWERLRVAQGRPMPDRELTEDYNPLEAGLWHTISLSKGCYIGQETIARLHTYRGVKQQLWGVRLAGEAVPDTPVFAGDEKIGKLTSAIDSIGLAYIRTKATAPDLTVQIGDTTGKLVALPYLSHEYP
ncbi:MAG: folate-binding protein YgfZ [Microcoleus sp. SIO2G3]|nr:folate-binding protein YgfZ [Microcoleus sp. SIO2G3]